MAYMLFLCCLEDGALRLAVHTTALHLPFQIFQLVFGRLQLILNFSFLLRHTAKRLLQRKVPNTRENSDSVANAEVSDARG